MLQEFEIVSGKSGAGVGEMGGQGEKQLELERRLLTDREASLREEISRLKSLRVVRAKDKKLAGFPTFAIIGYTNAGKTALMNFFTGENLISENLLFQTLN